MEVILLWKKTKTFFGLSKILNIFTKKWGDCDWLNLQKASDLVVPKNQSGLSLKILTIYLMNQYFRNYDPSPVSTNLGLEWNLGVV